MSPLPPPHTHNAATARHLSPQKRATTCSENPHPGRSFGAGFRGGHRRRDEPRPWHALRPHGAVPDVPPCRGRRRHRAVPRAPRPVAGPAQTRAALEIFGHALTFARRVRQEARWASLGESPALECAPPHRVRVVGCSRGWRRSGLKEKIVAGVDDMVEGKSIAGAFALFGSELEARRRLTNGAPRRARGGEGPDPDGDPGR